jgi:hypothetical protein
MAAMKVERRVALTGFSKVSQLVAPKAALLVAKMVLKRDENLGGRKDAAKVGKKVGMTVGRSVANLAD